MRRITLLSLLSLVLLVPQAHAIKLANGLFVSVASGSQTIGPFNIPDNINRFNLTLKRCTSSDLLTWPDANTAIGMTIQVSFDGGTTWVDTSSFTASGGISTRFGAETSETALSGNIPLGSNRKARIFVTVANGPLQTTLTLDMN